MNHENVWIGLDAAAGGRYQDSGVFDNWAEYIAALKRHQGNDISVEALPSSSNAWSWNHHALILHSFFANKVNFGRDDSGRDKFHPAHYHDWRGQRRQLKTRFYSEDKHTFRWLNGHARSWWSRQENPLQEFVNNCARFRHIPVLNPDDWSNNGQQVTTQMVIDLYMAALEDSSVGRFNSDDWFSMIPPEV